jgi:hypothetical protein
MDERISMSFKFLCTRVLRFASATEFAFSINPGVFGSLKPDVAIVVCEGSRD